VTIYEYTTSLTAKLGSVASSTLNIPGGLLRHVLVRANTDTTQFLLSISNSRSDNVVDYGVHTCEVNDWDITLPVTGVYTVTIKNASKDDTFRIQLGIQE